MAKQIQSLRNYMITPRRVALGYALVALAGLLLLRGWTNNRVQHYLQTHAQAQVSAQVNLLGDNLAQAVNQRLSLVSGLRAFVGSEIADGGLLQLTEFEHFATGLYNSADGIRNIAVAPDGVVQYVFPFDENRSVLGYEPAKDSRTYVRAEIQRAIETHQTVLSRPYELIQGGQGVIARQAIFSDEAYWGLANIVVDLPPLLEDTEIVPAPEGLELALKDQSGNIFHGSEDVFAADPVAYSLSLPEGSWTLAGTPTGGWGAIYRTELLVYRSLVLLIIIALTLVVYLFVNRQQRLTLRVEQRTREIAQQNIRLAQEIEERKRVEAALQQHTGQLEALRQASLSLTSNLKLQPVLDAILQHALQLVTADDAHIFLYDGEKISFGSVYWVDGRQTAPFAEPRQNGLTYTVARGGERVVVPDMSVHPIFQNWPLEGAIVGLPLRRGDQVLGVMNVALDQPHEFTGGELRILELLADQAAVAIDNARLHEQVRRHAEELEQRVDERTQELRAAQERLVRREKLAVLGQLAGGISHDLRNPLATINNAVFYLQLIHPDANETTLEYFDIIAQEVSNADSIISDLLNFARTRTPDRERVAVSNLVAEVLQKHPAPETVQVITDIPTDLPPVFVDPRQIIQAIGNLVDNAYQAMAEGGRLLVLGKVEESVFSVQSSVVSPPLDMPGDEQSAVGGQRSVLVLRISDTGIGIHPENMSKLFEPLFTTKFKGIGLGLATSRHLIETNEGSIHAESQVGQGTTFTIQLPLADDVVRDENKITCPFVS